jgi:hypothetical protein
MLEVNRQGSPAQPGWVESVRPLDVLRRLGCTAPRVKVAIKVGY